MLLMALPCPVSAQEEVPRETIDWAVAMGDRFRKIQNPVVVSHALARLAGTICPHGPLAASTLLREAFAGLDRLDDRVFSGQGPVLPVASLASLWKLLASTASDCDPDLLQAVDNERIRARLDEERREANSNIARARGMIDTRPDRAAQLGDSALASADPSTFNFPAFGLFLSELRERAADLADDLFPKALDLVASAPAPSPGLLSELGKYLFVASDLREGPDKRYHQRTTLIGGSEIADLIAIRHSANPDDIKLYIESAVRVLASAGNPSYDSLTAFSLGFQLLPKTPARAPEQAERLDRLTAQLRALAGEDAGRVESFLARSIEIDEFGGDSGIRGDRAIGQLLSAAASGRFDEARGLLTRVDDAGVRGQARAVIDFAEAARSIQTRNIERALFLANRLKPGVKRGLLYAGITSAAPPGQVFEIASLGRKDAEILPAEQRVVILSAVAAAMLRHDTEYVLGLVRDIVASANASLEAPRRWLFSPRVVRLSYRGPVAFASDSSLILFGNRGLYEVIDGGLGRHNFHLNVPGVTALSLPALVTMATAVDGQRLETIILDLRDETSLAAALNGLVEMRLKGRPIAAETAVQ
jgi:hypothetical protein